MERRVLTSICQATNSSKSAHVPKPYFMKKFQQDKRTKKLAEKALVSLIAHGYVSLHKTRNETTYELTDIGLDPTFRINTPIHNIFCSPARAALEPGPESRSALSAV